MTSDILLAFWFFVPAAFANMAPVFSAVIPGLDKLDAPIDGGRMYHGHRLLGDHKTWRGLISGMVAAIIVLWLQQLAVAQWEWAQAMTGQVDYNALPTLLLGAALGMGALAGDAVKSFFKRRYGIASGRSWFPFDQIDFILGAIVFSLPFVVLTPQQYAWAVILWIGLHLVAAYVGYLLKLKKAPI